MKARWQEAPLVFASEDEKGLIGSMLFDPDCIESITRDVRTTDFGDFALRAVFAAMVKHHKAAEGNGQALAAMVLAEIKGHPAVDDGRLLLTMIHDAVATAAHAPTFAKSVREAAIKRRLIDAAETAIKRASNGQAAYEVLADLLEFAECETRSGEIRTPFPRMTLAELRRDYPEQRPHVVDGLIREGQTMNIIGAPKVGKSWMVYGLLLSIANNERWLGRFDVQQGRVWLIDNELHPEDIRWRLDTVAEAMGIPAETIDREVEITSLRGNIQSLQDLDTSAIEPREFKLIVGDAAYRFATVDGDENSNTDQTKFYNLVDQIAAKTGAAVVLVHHSSKGDQSGKAVTDVGAGAGAQSRAADAHLIVRQHEESECFVLDAAVRSFAPVQPVVMRWAFPVWIRDDHLDPAKLAGRLGKGQQAKSEEDQADKANIVATLAEADEPLSTRKVRQATGFSKDKAERLLFALIADGAVESAEGTIGHNKCTVYSLASDEGGRGGTGVVTPPPAERTGGGGGAAPKGGPTTHPHQPGTPFPEFEQFEESA